MFRKMIITFGLGLLLAMPFTHSAMAANSQTVTLDVPGMTCKFCPITIRKALEKVPGVRQVKADFESKSATVTFDPDKTSAEALTRATANAGYQSTVREKP